ncbi:MAG: hypothetical protein PVF58_06420 [Candidatus Methanofastidiosia archaeon]|jgi:hypothetical protein
MDIYEIFLLLMGLGLVILGIRLLFKDIYRVSFLLISFGLVVLGWFWFLLLALGILTYFFVIMLSNWEAEGYLRREEEPPSNMRTVHTHEKKKSNSPVLRWLKR